MGFFINSCRGKLECLKLSGSFEFKGFMGYKVGFEGFITLAMSDQV